MLNNQNVSRMQDVLAVFLEMNASAFDIEKLK